MHGQAAGENQIVRSLVERGVTTRAAYEAAAREHKVTGRAIGDILVKNGFLRHRSLIDVMLETAPDLVRDERVIVPHIDPQALMKTRSMIVAETEQALYVASLSPEWVAREAIRKSDPRNVEFVPASVDRIDAYLADVERMHAKNEESQLDLLLHETLGVGASDIHIVPRRETYTIFIRRLGVREIQHEGTMDEYHVLVARIKDRARMDLSERRIPQDGGFQIEYGGRFVDLRIATVPSVYGEVVVIRLLDQESVNVTLDGLGINPLAEWRAGTSRTDGLCLICGPTGSGKTTTLNATLREMDRFGRSIFTAEDPVEYQLPYVGQVNINPLVGLDFSRALKAFMRADPDIIVLGEVRDEETARNMSRAAETGHLVMATLHAGSIHGAAQRMKDLGVDVRELKFLLRSVLVQRLVRTICQSCRGVGCPRCHGTGYGGRTIVSEGIYFRDERDVARMLSGERWWPTLADDALLKCEQGVTDQREVERVFGEEVARG